MYKSNRILGQLYGIDDFVIMPEVITDIESRTKDCNAKYPADKNIGYEHYGLFTAPMTPVVGPSNYENYKDNGVIPIIPRTTPLQERLTYKFETFIALGKTDFLNEIINTKIEVPAGRKLMVCIDVANGHMKSIINMSSKAKDMYGDKIVIMAGNIANPKTYPYYAKAGISYIRCGIGSGNVCTTAANTGVHCPLGSLILGCKEEKERMAMELMEDERRNIKSRLTVETLPKIVADGGFSNFDQINKAYALGADYVMLGKLFAMTDGGCGKTFKGRNGIPLVECTTEEMGEEIENHSVEIVREYYGMSTRKAQKEMGKTDEECRTSEGIVKYVDVRYTLRGWLDNMEHYLKSAMSYCNCNRLSEFVGFPTIGLVSPLARAAFYK